MVIVLVVLTFMVFIAAGMLVARRQRSLAAEGASVVEEAHPAALSPCLEPKPHQAPPLPGGLHYHPGHTWARAAEDGLVEVGLDELAGKVVGGIDSVSLPEVGASVRQGEVAWTITRRGRKVSLVSPVTGVVEVVNQEVGSDPTLITKAPYTEGWAFKARLSRMKEDLEGLYKGSHAKKFLDLAKTWICFTFSPSSYRMLTYQDGGELVEGIGDRLDDEEWAKLKKELFLTY